MLLLILIAKQITTCQPDWQTGNHCICPVQGEERRDRRKVQQLHTVQPTTPLTTALSMLLDAGVSVLPIVDAVSCGASLPPTLKPCTDIHSPTSAACCGNTSKTWTKSHLGLTTQMHNCAERGAH